MARPLTSPRPAARRSTAGSPAPRVHGRLWRELAEARAPITATLLSAVVGTSFQTVDHRLGLWVRAGLVERLAGRPGRYRLHDTTERSVMPPIITAAGAARPRRAAAYQRLWAAIRILRRFDAPALRVVAGSGEQTTRRYLSILKRAGYLRIEQLAAPWSGEHSRYSLIRNTGRHAPGETVVMIDGAPRRLIVDPNTGERHDISPRAARSRPAPAPADGGVG